jgi:ubiquinone/menaquinone biosynthesis C-methylase UbiE
MAKRSTSVILACSVAHLMAPTRAGAQAVETVHEAHRLHRDSAAYIAALEDPARDAWQKPHEVISALDVAPGEVVADIGAGSGYFALRFARHVGPSGRVFAVDVSGEMLMHLERRAAEAGLSQLVTVLAPPDDPRLPDGSIDRVFICDVWHHIEDREVYLARIKRALRPSGQLVMIDFQARDLPVGPPASMKIAREELIAEVQANGFRLVREHTFLPYQYFLVFAPR